MFLTQRKSAMDSCEFGKRRRQADCPVELALKATAGWATAAIEKQVT
jgi:hypothetical protein